MSNALELPAAICGYPIPGWRLDSVSYDRREGVPDGWIVSLEREESTPRTSYTVMARSTLGPLEAWDEALKLAVAEDARTSQELSK